jgi:RimJ/RimL family protein N-acetyltransferase
MFGPELHHQNEHTAITLAPIEYDDLPHAVDEQIKEYLHPTFDTFLTNLTNHYAWVKDSPDNIHWGIYEEATERLLGITGVRSLDLAGEGPAISRIAFFTNESRGNGVGTLAYRTQYEYLLKERIAPLYEHSAMNANVGSLRIAQKVGFVAVRRDAMRTTMHLRQT